MKRRNDILKSKPSVSLCMIVKNEEEYLDRCLNSVQRLVDEIIIVDTGSTDRTKEICRKHSAKIFDFVWTESFAEARNFGINKAEGEWIFWIDADEEVTLKDAEKFRNALESEKKDIFLIPLINYYGTFPADINKAYLYTSQRLFRNYKGVKFIGNIHEHLNVQDVKENFAQEVKISMKGISIYLNRKGSIPITIHGLITILQVKTITANAMNKLLEM